MGSCGISGFSPGPIGTHVVRDRTGLTFPCVMGVATPFDDMGVQARSVNLLETWHPDILFVMVISVAFELVLYPIKIFSDHHQILLIIDIPLLFLLRTQGYHEYPRSIQVLL